MNRAPHWAVSLIPFLVLAATLFLVILGFGADALAGGSQVALIFAAGFTVVLAMLLYKIPWKVFEESILDNITSVGTSIVILLLIGAVSGSWMVSGVVPTMIYYGMKVIIPEIFLFATCVISAVIAVMQYIYDNTMYAELNIKSDYCQVCGYDGEIKIVEDNGKLVWECPNCGNRDQSKLNGARRTCGFIGTQFWNQGRTQEIRDRVVHLSDN